ncbi:hypothetical protein D3C85_1137410 [compost metagenome]
MGVGSAGRHEGWRVVLAVAQAFDLQLHGQAVAVKAGDIRREIALQPLELDHRVLQALVDGMAKMQGAIGVGRPIVQEKQRARALRAMKAIDD